MASDDSRPLDRITIIRIMVSMENKHANYVAPDGSEHMRDEERQWLDIVSDPDPVKGMLLVFIQKLCSAFHELGPALESGALGDGWYRPWQSEIPVPSRERTTTASSLWASRLQTRPTAWW